MTINEYLENVFCDFKKLVEHSQDICSLKGLTFERGIIPDYTDEKVQLLYILRYTFAYAYEYREMYKEILNQFDNTESLNVTSFGCGPMTDYWSLNEACKTSSRRFSYTGVDIIDWSHKFKQCPPNGYGFINKDVVKYLEDNNTISSNVLFFPKSIGEFSDDDFSLICDNLSTAIFLQDKIAIGVSLRNESYHNKIDTDRINRLVASICKNNFKITKNDPTSYSDSTAIISCDGSFKYPDDSKYYIANLQDKCKNHEICENNCSSRLNRQPMLYITNINYKIILLER